MNKVTVLSQRQVSALTQFAVERASDSVVCACSDALVIYANAATCRSLGYSQQEMLSLRIWDFDGTIKIHTWPELWRELKERKALFFESHHRTKEGGTYPVEVSVNHLEFAGTEYCVGFARDISERKRAEEAFRELSTPVLQVSAGLLVVPLIGTVDVLRARQLTTQLLHSIRSRRAGAVVVDITGVPTMDSPAANCLIQVAAAAQLLGAQIILTGMSREIAQTFVALGIDSSKWVSTTDLQSGIEEGQRLLADRGRSAARDDHRRAA